MTSKYIKPACELNLWIILLAFWTQTCFLINSVPSGNNKNVNKRMIKSLWCQPQNFTISVSPDSNHPTANCEKSTWDQSSWSLCVSCAVCHLWRYWPAFITAAAAAVSLSDTLSGSICAAERRVGAHRHGGKDSTSAAASSASLLAWTPEKIGDQAGIMPTVLGGKGKLSIVCFLLRCACSQVRGGTLINQWSLCVRVCVSVCVRAGAHQKGC